MSALPQAPETTAPETAAPRHPRVDAALLAGVVLLGLDALVVLLTGGASLLSLRGDHAVGPLGFAVGLVAFGLVLSAWIRPRVTSGTLVLLLLLLPTLWQFQFAGGRISGDGVNYYVFTRSLMKDHDVDLTNEYTHYGLITRGDLAVPTRTGLRRSIFAIGPALVGMPSFAVGEVMARVQQAAGAEADLSGYGPCHRNAVALGNLLYGFLAVLLIHDLLRRHFAAPVALLAALLTWLATFLHWYMVQQPTMSHAPSAFGGALVLWLWDRNRGRRTWGRDLLLGAVIGFAMCLRWQNGVLLILPGLDVLGDLWARRRDLKAAGPVIARGTAILAAAAVGAFPQMEVWKTIYGEYLLPCPPHGCDFVRLDHPFVLVTFFSSRHGLLAWTPVFWAAYLGFLPLGRRRPRLAAILAVPLVLMTYVNLCSGDWWAGGSFSNRRFDGLLPVLAFGLAAALEWGETVLRARGAAVLAAAALLLAAWNTSLLVQVRRGGLPGDAAVAFPDLVGRSAQVVSQTVGSPTTWPASWLFSLREHRPPDQYDVLVGRYLFYRQNNLGGRLAVGSGDDARMLGEGWGDRELVAGEPCRRIMGSARAFAPLDVPEDLLVKVKVIAAAETPVTVRVNGTVAGELRALPAWSERAVWVPRSAWRRELNDVVLESGGEVRVGGFEFVRKGRS